MALEHLEKRLVLSWPAAPLAGGDFESTIYVDQTGDATIDQRSIDPAGDVDGYHVFFDQSGSLTFETTGATDTVVALYEGSGPPVAEDDDNGVAPNGRISAAVSASRGDDRICSNICSTRGSGISRSSWNRRAMCVGAVGEYGSARQASSYGSNSTDIASSCRARPAGQAPASASSRASASVTPLFTAVLVSSVWDPASTKRSDSRIMIAAKRMVAKVSQ